MSHDTPTLPRGAADSGDTFFLPEAGRWPRASGLPGDLLAQAARRLRVLCLLYAFVFFMSAFFPVLFFQNQRAYFLSNPTLWAPGAIAICVALLVAALTRSQRVPVRTVMQVGLAFEVVSSFGIAMAEFLDPASIDFNAHWVGLSWVSAWVLMFAVVVPNSPRRTLLAALASVSSVPLVIGFVAYHNQAPGVTVEKFFFGLVSPYILVSVMAYVGARVVHSLGREVARARELGSYRLVGRLGAGGMGEVWRAEHRLLARPAAIKLVRPDALGTSDVNRRDEIHERFAREARTTAMLRSPHTIELYDFGVARDGTFYYVMELLDGLDMEALVERFGPVPVERATSLLIQVCHSLSEAHGEGLIHRDVKPANVYVCRYGREVDFVKVLDFGLVTSRHTAVATEARLTAQHAIMGTPAFMAPEQLLGNRDVDGRADLYSVGCLAYWLVTGEHVFRGESAMEVMLLHTHKPPSRPSARAEQTIPAALDRLVLDCLAKDPDERPASADELAARLASIHFASPWTAVRAHDWWERNLSPGSRP